MGAAPTTPPLAWLTQLSRRVHLYRPAPSAASAIPADAPKLILLATWMGAADAHIAKYAQTYRTLYPSSPILLVRSEPGDFFWPRSSGTEISTAAGVVRATFPESSTTALTDRSPQLLIHVWSNGGSTMLARLRAALVKRAAAAPAASSIIPPYTLVLDSAPGQFHYSATYNAFALTLKTPWLRRLVSPLLHALCSWFWILSTLGKWRRARALKSTGVDKPRGPLELSAAAHNDPRWLDCEVRRTYIYSNEDALIQASDVEQHAADAVAQGFAVRREKFKGTAHVAHARFEPERYWSIAEETWADKSDGEEVDGASNGIARLEEAAA